MMSIQKSEQINVLMMPDYREDNPYQTLLAQALEKQQVKVVFPQGYRRVFPFYRGIQDCPEKIDILHLHWFTPYFKGDNFIIQGIYAMKILLDILLVKSKGIKIIWTIHNRISHDCQYPIIEKWLRYSLCKLVNGIIVHNESAKSLLPELQQKNIAPIAVIPHGHYRDYYGKSIDKMEARKALNLPLSGLIFLNLGMLRPYKGIEKLLAVWKDNQDFLSESTLVIAGKALDEDYGHQLKSLTHNLSNIHLFDRFIEDKEIPYFFSACDVVVLPFEKMLTSGSLILAMSYNKPIIAPDTGSIPETLGEANWLMYKNQDLVDELKNSLQLDLDSLSSQIESQLKNLDWNNIALNFKDFSRTIKTR